MSSSSTSYIVAPNSTVDTTPYIPSQTQLNGTGPIVDLVPQIIRNVNSPGGVALNNSPSTTTVVYTSPSSVGSAGTYLVSANFVLSIQGGISWTNGEAIVLTVSMTGGGVQNRPALTLQPSYFSQFPAVNQPINATVTGLIETTISGQITCNVSRFGTLSTDKFGDIFSLTVQKIA